MTEARQSCHSTAKCDLHGHYTLDTQFEFCALTRILETLVYKFLLLVGLRCLRIFRGRRFRVSYYLISIVSWCDNIMRSSWTGKRLCYQRATWPTDGEHCNFKMSVQIFNTNSSHGEELVLLCTFEFVFQKFCNFVMQLCWRSTYGEFRCFLSSFCFVSALFGSLVIEFVRPTSMLGLLCFLKVEFCLPS